MPDGSYIPTLLYVDDNIDDLCLLETAIARAAATFRLITISDLDEAIDYLREQGKFEDKQTYPQPDLLLLDYNLGVPSALDLLRWLDQDAFKLPVVIFSGMLGTAFQQPCFEAGADVWMEKPSAIRSWNDITAALQLCLASIPPKLEHLSNVGTLSNRRLRAELRVNINEHRRLMQQRRELTQLLDGTLAEQKETKKRIPFPGR